MRLIKRIFKIIGILVLVAGVGTLYVLNRGGAFRQIEPHFAGSCESLPLAASAEDMTVDRERGFVYISYLDRQSLVKGDGTNVQGTIMRSTSTASPWPSRTPAGQPAHLDPRPQPLRDPGRRSLFRSTTR
jgi:hypothetical protein